MFSSSLDELNDSTFTCGIGNGKFLPSCDITKVVSGFRDLVSVVLPVLLCPEISSLTAIKIL